MVLVVGVLALAYVGEAPPADVVGRWVYFLVLMGVVLVFATSNVRTDPGGIRIRNFLRIRHLPWGRIRSFRMLQFPGGFPGTGAVVLDDGATVRMWGILPAKGYRRDSALRAIEELNRLLSTRRNDASSG